MDTNTPSISEGSVWHMRGAPSVKVIVESANERDVHFIRLIVTREREFHNHLPPGQFLRDYVFVAEALSPGMIPEVDLDPVNAGEVWLDKFQESKMIRVTKVTATSVRFRSLGCPDAPCQELDIWIFRHRWHRQPKPV